MIKYKSKNINYDDFNYVINNRIIIKVMAVCKVLQNKVETYETKINTLESDVDTLKSLVQTLQSEVNILKSHH